MFPEYRRVLGNRGSAVPRLRRRLCQQRQIQRAGKLGSERLGTVSRDHHRFRAVWCAFGFKRRGLDRLFMLYQPKLLDRTQPSRFKVSGVRCDPRSNMLGKRCGPSGKNLGCPSRRCKRGIETHVNMRRPHGLIACARPILRIAAGQRCQTCHKIGGLLPRIMLGV